MSNRLLYEFVCKTMNMIIMNFPCIVLNVMVVLSKLVVNEIFIICMYIKMGIFCKSNFIGRKYQMFNFGNILNAKGKFVFLCINFLQLTGYTDHVTFLAFKIF